MKRTGPNRAACWLLILAMLLGIFGAVPAMAANETERLELADLGPAADAEVELDGSVDNDVHGARVGWTNDALPQETMAALINSQELHPQRTGYVELDSKLDELLAPYKDKDAYTKIQAIYEWAIANVVYTHNGYGYVEGAANQYDYLLRTFYVEQMTYEEGLEHAIPDKVINHASYALFEERGACYDYASLMAVAIRHVGINAYVHTGYWILESDGSTNNHHGWCEIELDGKLYIIDAQREARYTEKVGSNHNIYFGIPHENGADWRYWSPDTADNADRDALFLAVDAARQDPAKPVVPVDPVGPDEPEPDVPDETVITVVVSITGNGAVICDGTAVGENTYQFKAGDRVHMEAVPGKNSAFRSWWDKNMREYLLATNPDYEGSAQISADEGVTFFLDDSIVVTEDGVAVIEAVFEDTVDLTIISSRSGSVKCDSTDAVLVQQHLKGTWVNLTAEPQEGTKLVGWYDGYGNLLSTKNRYSFVAQSNQTVYALYEGDVFCDLEDGDWYLDAAVKSAELGLVNGVTAVTFGGEEPFNRAMAATLLQRIDSRINGEDTSKRLDNVFTDVSEDDWYFDAVNWAYSNGVVTGDTETTFSPLETVTRQDFVTMAIRYVESLDQELKAYALDYTDAEDIADYALPMLEKAQGIGLITGYEDGTFQPERTLNRAEGVTIILRLVEFLEQSETPAVPAA